MSIFIRKKILLSFYICLVTHTYAQTAGADAGYLYVEKALMQIPIHKHTLYTFTDEELSIVLTAAADIKINMFELLDCFYRYLAPRNMRVEITGESFRKLKTQFDYGGHPVVLLFPVETLEKVQTGVCFSNDEKALDIYLSSAYSSYVDIATVLYEKRCGFEKIEPLLFSQAYGMKVKKWGIRKVLDRIHFYEPGYAAVYVKNFYRPKRWGFNAVSRLPASGKP